MALSLYIFAFLCSAFCVAETAEAEQGFKNLQIQQDSLTWLNELQDKEVKFLYFTHLTSACDVLP